VGDNATSNNSELIKILNLHPNINITVNNCIRCAGHIVKLVVKATIYGKGVSDCEEQLAEAAPCKQFELWRRLGVVGKLHNFVNAVCASHKRRELFHSVQSVVNTELLHSFSTLELRQDGGVRWNSVYLMLLRCYELHKHINRFIHQLRGHDASLDNLDYGPLKDTITEEEWDDIKDLVNFLQAPYKMTKWLEGNNSGNGFGSLWQTLPNLQALWMHFEEAGERPHSEYIASAIALGTEKLNTYFTMLVHKPGVSYYTIATMLNPALRFNWVQIQWKRYSPWVVKAQKSFKKVFDDYAKQDASADDNKLREPPPSRRKLPANDLYTRATAVDTYHFTGNKNKRQRHVGQVDEYFEALYSNLNTTNEQDLPLLEYPYKWWQRVGRAQYPILFKMATNYLAIPSTSCNAERAFSSARRTITDDRNGLSGSTIKALQLQKNWIWRDVVKSSNTRLAKQVVSLTKTSSFCALDSTLNGSFNASISSQNVFPGQ
jgi:hypothetical protein